MIVGGFSFGPLASAHGLRLAHLIIEGQISILAGGMEGGIIEDNQIRGPWGITGLRPADLTIRNNVVVGGAIELMDDPLARTYAAQGAMQRSVIEGNVLHDAWIAIGGDDSTSDNAIRRNVVRGGGITLFNVFGQLRNNVVEGNLSRIPRRRHQRLRGRVRRALERLEQHLPEQHVDRQRRV